MVKEVAREQKQSRDSQKQKQNSHDSNLFWFADVPIADKTNFWEGWVISGAESCLKAVEKALKADRGPLEELVEAQQAGEMA